PELVLRGMQTVRQIIASARLQRCVNELLSQELHIFVCHCAPTLAEEHDECDHWLVRVSEKRVIVRLNFSYGYIEQVGMMRANNASGLPKERHCTFLWKKVFVQDVCSRVRMVQIPIR